MGKLLPIVLVLFASNAFGEPIADLRKKAAAGDAAAQTTLGVRYANGKGVRKNYKEAVKWYRKAAEQGDAAGQYNLGLMYRIGIGRGVPKDYVAAYAWYRLAAYSGFKGGSKSRETYCQGNDSGADRRGTGAFQGTAQEDRGEQGEEEVAVG